MFRTRALKEYVHLRNEPTNAHTGKINFIYGIREFVCILSVFLYSNPMMAKSDRNM